jgi:ribosome modulation factor
MKLSNKKGPMLVAWKKGYQAYIDGKTLNDNPYYCPTPMSFRWFRSWREGWNAAKDNKVLK